MQARALCCVLFCLSRGEVLHPVCRYDDVEGRFNDVTKRAIVMKAVMLAVTRKRYEMYLNEVLSVCPFESVEDAYGYLAPRYSLRRAYDEGRLGSLIRKSDPVLFNVNYSEYRRRYSY